MPDEKLLTVREVSLILGMSEREVVELAESEKVPAYKVGGVYLRFRKDQVQEYKKSLKTSVSNEPTPESYSFKDRLRDFLYFNDFYILTAIIIIILVFIIFKGY